MRAVAPASSAGAVLRAATVTSMTRPSVERSDRTRARSRPGERCLVAARGPENATPREAMKFAAYGVQINRSRWSCNRLRCCEGCAPNRALGASAECALRMPLWRTGGVPCGTDVMSPTYARAMFASTSFERPPHCASGGDRTPNGSSSRSRRDTGMTATWGGAMTRLPRLLLIVALAVPGLVWEWPRPIVRLDAAAFRGRRKAARRIRRSAHPGRFRGGGGVRAQLRLESSPVSSSSATEHPPAFLR